MIESYNFLIQIFLSSFCYNPTLVTACDILDIVRITDCLPLSIAVETALRGDLIPTSSSSEGYYVQRFSRFRDLHLYFVILYIVCNFRGLHEILTPMCYNVVVAGLLGRSNMYSVY